MCGRSFIQGLLISLGILLTLSAPTTRAQIVFSDGIFNDNDWSIFANGTNGANQSTTQFPSGGNPNEFRLMQHFLPPMSSILVFHTKNGATYTPQTQGPIAALNYSEDQMEQNPPFVGAAIGATGGLAV